jgi:hypothetical protein
MTTGSEGHRRAVHVGSVFGLAILSLGLCVPGVSADSAGTESATSAPADDAMTQAAFAARPHDIQYGESDLNFRSSQLRIVSGVRQLDGSCWFEGELRASPSTPAVGQEEIAYDPDTCQSLVRYGELRSASEPSAESATATTQSEVSSDSESASLGLVPSEKNAVLYQRQLASGYTAWEDPFQLDVNKSKNEVNWRPSRYCAGARSSDVNMYLSWRSGTGWYKEYRDWIRYSNCERVASTTHSSFENPTFCAANVTNTWYLPNRVWGLPAANAVHGWEAGKSGGCTDLLHLEHKLTVNPA